MPEPKTNMQAPIGTQAGSPAAEPAISPHHRFERLHVTDPNVIIPNFDSGVADRLTLAGDLAREPVNQDGVVDFGALLTSAPHMARPPSKGIQEITRQFVYDHITPFSPMMLDATTVYVDSTAPVTVQIPDASILFKAKCSVGTGTGAALLMSFAGVPAVPAAVGASAPFAFLLMPNFAEWYYCYGKTQVVLAVNASAVILASFEFFKQD